MLVGGRYNQEFGGIRVIFTENVDSRRVSTKGCPQRLSRIVQAYMETS